MKKMNKGEWSEPYCLLKVISDGELSLCDSDLKSIGKTIKVIGGNLSDDVSFEIKDGVVSFNDHGFARHYPIANIKPIASKILQEIQKKQSRTFSINETEDFFEYIGNPSMKAGSFQKADCNLSVYDQQMEMDHDFGFSIKSFLAGSPSLVNAGRSTNFIYDVGGCKPEHKEYKTKKLISSLINDGYSVDLNQLESSIYYNNLMLIDTQMPLMISEILKNYFASNKRGIKDLVDFLKQDNPLNLPDIKLYENKITDFLFYSATGMFPSKNWKGRQEADGGCLIVKEDGEVVTFYICRKASLDYFRTYLYNKCFLDTASTTRHKFGRLYNDDGLKVKLNLQVRISS